MKRFLKILLIVTEYSPLAIFWMLKAFLFDFAASKIAFRRLPEAGKSIGLKHLKSERIAEFGELKGTIAGCNVIVKPFEHLEPIIIVELKQNFDGLEISLSKALYRTNNGIVDFVTPDKKFNKIFRTKRANAKMSEKIIQNDKFLNSAVKFYNNWLFRIAYMNIGGSEIYCKLKAPDHLGFFPYIPSSKLKTIVTDLVELAVNID